MSVSSWGYVFAERCRSLHPFFSKYSTPKGEEVLSKIL